MKSTCSFLFYDSPQSYTITSNNEVEELTILLIKYRSDLGVVAYEADFDDLTCTVKWKLQDKWYSTSQIERLIKIRSFL